MTLSTHLRRNLIRGLIILAVAAVAWGGWQSIRVWRAWAGRDTLPFNLDEAREALAQLGGGGPTPTTIADPAQPDGEDVEGTLPPNITIPTSPQFSADALQAFLIIGSDFRPERGVSVRADVILLFLRPADGSDPILVSLPRDLYLPNPCSTTGSYTRINANLNGCGDTVTGPELLAVAVEDFTGVKIDHLAMFDFEGFTTIVDRVGGVDICVDNAVRDLKSELNLPAGCSRADGTQTLAWIRSRHTQELVNGVWRSMSGVNDLTRNQRQQQLLLEALSRLKAFRSITEFSSLVESVADAFAVDEGLTFGDAVSLAWGMRGIPVDDIKRPTIPVRDYVTEGGAYVLIPQASFAEVLESAYPGASDTFADN